MKDYLILLNPKAGKGKAKKTISIIENYMKLYNKSFEIYNSKSREGTISFVSENESNFENLIVAGGDGTLNSVINGIQNFDINLLVLPAGSGNDFAKMLWGKMQHEEILKTHLEKNSKIINSNRISVALSDNNSDLTHFKFVNAIGIGFDSYVAKINQNSKTFSGLLSYIIAVFKGLNSFDKVSSRIKIDGKEIDIPTEQTILTIGNNKTSGGGFYLNPRAEVGDGILDISTITRLKKLQILRKLPYTLMNKTEKIKEFIQFTGKEIEIELLEPFIVHADGEIFSDFAKHIKINICDKNLKFYGV